MTRTHEQNVRGDLRHLIHPYTPLHAPGDDPLVIRRGDGVWVENDRGRRYLEAMSGLWCASLGFSEPRLVEAAARQMRELPYYHLFSGRSNEASIALSERLLAMTAHLGMDRAFYANSGSEANDTAVKLVWYYFNATGRPAKKKLIARERGYHGVTVMAASLTGLPYNHADFDLPIGRVLRTGCPSPYHHARPGESDAAFVERLCAELEALIEREGPDTIAAFFAEPVQGAGGVIVPPAGYFERVQAILRRHDILFVADEVICGFGRTGRAFGCDTFGIRPDMVTVAKALSGAYVPISATLVSRPVWDALVEGSRRNGTFGHGFTYSGHPLAAAVALEALRVYEERDVFGHAARLAPGFQARLHALADHPLVAGPRGVGLVGAFELVADRDARAPFDAALGVPARLVRAAVQRGLIVRALGTAIALCPPLVIAEPELDVLFGRLRLALDDTLAALRRDGHAPA